MTSFVRLQNDGETDDLRAVCWQLQYEEWLLGLASLAANPRTNGIGAMVAPSYGDPIDWDTRTRRLVWVTQACRSLQVHPMAGNRALAVCGPDVERWSVTGATTLVLPSAALATLRNTPADRTAARARALLGVTGTARSRPVTVPAVETRAEVLARNDDFAAKLQELETVP